MKHEIAVIGLGKFGLYFASTLVDLGFTVIGIDNRQTRVQMAKDQLNKVYRADATNKEALEQVGLAEVSHVLISVGDSLAASSMIAMYAKEMEIPRVWVKAVSADHQRLLYKLGVDEVIIPEQMAAVQLASKVAIPGFLQYATFDPEVSFQELTIDKWAGKSLRTLDLTRKHQIQVISVKRGDSDAFEYTPDPDYVFQPGDTIIVLRNTNTSDRIKS
ncbi:MAG TPA: TrkA family potassium uptake protein [Desulfobulbaceae bacterium]|nr:TrkA family potassium uptake protein [Desulfobulbaceae bacterium]